MKSILFISYTMSNGGGAERLLASYANSIDSSKYSVCIQEIERFNVKKEALNPNVKLKKIPFYSSKKSIFFPMRICNHYFLSKNPAVLKSVFNLDGFDCVVSWNYQLPSFMLPAFKKSYKIAWFHGDIYDLELTEKNKNANNNLEKNNKLQKDTWSCADSIVTISLNSYKSLKKVFPDFLSKAFIINGGCSFKTVKEKSNENTNFILDKKYKYLVCAGRIDKNKNFELAIRSLYEIRKTRSDIKLVIIGAGELENDYKQLCLELNLADHVLFAGYLENPFPLIKQCNVFCLTSYSEGFPMVILEAMSLGIPFVTTKVSGASEELYNNGKCGVISDWTVEDYSQKILKLIDDKPFYYSLKKNCLEHCENYTVENALDKLYEIMEKSTYEKNDKTERKLFNTIAHKISYFLFALLGINFSFLKDTKKLIVYVFLHLLSLCFLPLKAVYILVYMILAGR